MANLSTQNNSLRLFTSLKIRIGDILGETIGFLQETFKQSKTIFTAASPFGQLLIVFENLSQLIFYYIEDSITELNIYEASRASSIYSLASLAGHNPSRAIGATAQIRIKPKTGVTFENNIIILNDLLKIKCTNNGLQYVLELPQDELRLDLTDSQTLTVLGIRQGEVQSQTFTAKGIAFESYQMGLQNNYYVDNFKVNVYVKDSIIFENTEYPIVYEVTIDNNIYTLDSSRYGNTIFKDFMNTWHWGGSSDVYLGDKIVGTGFLEAQRFDGDIKCLKNNFEFLGFNDSENMANKYNNTKNTFQLIFSFIIIIFMIIFSLFIFYKIIKNIKIN